MRIELWHRFRSPHSQNENSCRSPIVERVCITQRLRCQLRPSRSAARQSIEDDLDTAAQSHACVWTPIRYPKLVFFSMSSFKAAQLCGSAMAANAIARIFKAAAYLKNFEFDGRIDNALDTKPPSEPCNATSTLMLRRFF